MAVTASLRQIVEELEILPEEATLYLDRESGELYPLGDEEASLVEEGREDELPDWLCDEAPRIRELLTSARWLSLPTRFDIHEWAIMDAFTRSLDDPDLADELRAAIHRRGAFRAFKDALYRRGAQRDWFRFRDAAIADIAADWLDEHGVAYARDLDPA
jgi:Uncharacterised protein family (UPF0158)